MNPVTVFFLVFAVTWSFWSAGQSHSSGKPFIDCLLSYKKDCS